MPDGGRLISRDGVTSGVSRLCKALSVDARLDLSTRFEGNSESDEEKKEKRKRRHTHCTLHGGSLPAISMDSLALAPVIQPLGESPLTSQIVDRPFYKGADKYPDKNGGGTQFKNQYGSMDNMFKPIQDTMHGQEQGQGQGQGQVQGQGQGQLKTGYITPNTYNGDGHGNATARILAGEEREREMERERGEGEERKRGEGKEREWGGGGERERKREGEREREERDRGGEVQFSLQPTPSRNRNTSAE